MSWNYPPKNLSDELTHTEYNDMVTCIIRASGNAISGAEWFWESSQKLSDMSGNINTKINQRPIGDTISSNFFTKNSGQILWSFSSNSKSLYHPSGYVISGDQYSRAYASAQATKELAYTDGTTIAGDNLTWDGTHLNAQAGGLDGDTVSSNFFLKASGNRLYDWMINSGAKYSEDYLWFTNSSSRLSEPVISSQYYSKAWVSTQALQDLAFFNETDIDALGTIGTGIWQGTVIDYNYLDTTAIPNISSNAITSYNWYTESSSKLSSISGTLSNRITTLEGYDEFDHELYIVSSVCIDRFADSSNIQIKITSPSWVSSQAGISGNWRVPLFGSLTEAGAANTRPGQLIRTSGNANGTWVWISIWDGATSPNYQWMQLTYLKLP